MKILIKIALWVIGAIVLTNPLTSQYIVKFLDWALITSAQYTVWVSVVGGAYLAGLMFFILWMNRDEKKIPKKNAKTSKDGMKFEVAGTK